MSNTQVNLRITTDLKERLDLAAKENNRSLNSELVTRLEDSFYAKPDITASTEQQILHADYIEAKKSLEDITKTVKQLKSLLGN